MKVTKTLKLLLCLMFVVSLLGVNTVAAHEGADDTTTETTTTESEATPKKTLEERLAARKEAMKTKLTNAQQTRLKARCKASQGLINSLHVRVKGLEKNRTSLYDKVIDKLNALVTKIGDKADTTELKAEIEVLQQKVDHFEADIAAYKQAISDLGEMDCAADPAAFKSSLDEAKTLHANLLQTSKDIRAYINDTIKPTLQNIRASLQKETDEGTN